MKICFAAVAASTLLVFAAAEERHNLRQVKGGVLAELAEADTDLEVYSDSEAYSDSESYYSYDFEPKSKKWKGKGCPDPAGAIMGLLDCLESEDAACASAAYDPGFELFHNTVPDDQGLALTEEFWTGFFIIQDVSFDVDFYDNPDHNQAVVRYIETVTTFDGSDGTTPPITDYPFSQTFMQHEFALIDVDDDCKLLKWDQYGDNKERTDVIEATAAILSILLT